jgi:hypothetical protein
MNTNPSPAVVVMEPKFDARVAPGSAVRFAMLIAFVCLALSHAVMAGSITYVQGNYATPQTSKTTVNVPFTAAQSAGDLNVVVVGWNDSTATVSTVKDTLNNSYILAVGPTVQAGVASQSIYYAKNIAGAAAGANTVTVTFASAAAYPDIRILEYKGADLANPVDVTAASSGNSATSSSGAVTTTNATDLLFGANLVQSVTTGPGSGFTKRLLTQPDADIAEDRAVTATGSYSASAPISPSDPWIMQMVAFRTAATAPPTVSSVSPNSGSTLGGTAVTIMGTNFAAGATVAFGGAAATNVVVVNSTTITATTPAVNAGAVTVTVTVSGQNGSLTNGYTYVWVPTVTSVSPNNGPPAGGTAVTITGTNFAAGATATFGGTAATNVVVVNSTTITATTPAHAAGSVTVTVTVNGQSGNLTNGFSYVVPPTVSSVSPNSGSTLGGTAVTIAGTNFAAGATVTFGSAAATNVGVVNSTTITATTPAGSVGAVTVMVTNPGSQSGSLTNGYTYVVVPTVTSVSPNSGSTAGGTEVTITGTNFAAGATATFGGAAATNVVVVNSTTITATTRAGTGTVTVTVTVNGQSGSLTNGFTYLAPPTVSSVSPNSGSTLGGTAVTITGTNFASGATVTFGGGAATNVVVVNSTTITATAPAGSAGAVTVTVTVNGQNGSLTNGYTYVVVPTVTSVSPNNGSTAGGTAVTITGTNFGSGATATFGGAAATNVVVLNSTTITATTPAHASGAVMVTVTVNGQSGNLANGFTYNGAVAISFVQVAAATPQSSTATVSVAYPEAETAGDMNVVVVGWNDTTATVQSVKDSGGNNYVLAIGPTSGTGLRQSIYYLSNIVGGANTVTVTFSQAAAFPDVRILEYRGVTAADVTAGASGNSAAANSGAATTTSPYELIFGANMVFTGNAAAGNGFTTRIITSPDGDIAEDEVVTTAGSTSATAALTSSGPWVMQMVTFIVSGESTLPLVTLSPTGVSFGNEQTGLTSSPQPVTMTNVGGANLSISSILISGGNAGDFGQTNNCGATLLPNNSCTINVTFTPTTTGARSSSVAVTDNGPGSPQTVTLSGTGTGFAVTPRVTELTFSMTQQFTATSGSPTWSVDGVVGGSASSGTISSSGLYSPPNSTGSHTVTASITNPPQQANATVYVTNYGGTFTFHNDNMRTGQNLNETVLTPANVNPAQFGKLFSYSIDGIAFASPLYVPSVSIPGKGSHNVVYVATENDSMYAFDADGLSSSPLWHVSFLKSGVTTVPCGDVGECGDIPVQIGITSTPVIDPTSGTIYVVAKTKEGTNHVQRLHALDITTGAEKFGGPVVLAASVPGTGGDSSGGKETFNPLRENQRTGLLLSNGVIYFGFGSHGDNSPWHGWVLGYDATTLQQVLAYNDTPNGNFGGGGIWQSGGGLATDATGSIYFTTSNGDFDADTGGVDYADSIEKLSPSGSVVDYFTPYDQSILSSNNLDFGSAGPVLLIDQSGPYPHLLISAGKNGTIYVINRDNMGKYNTNNDNQVVQSLVNALQNGDQEVGNFSAPVYFDGYVYFAAVNDSLKAFQMTNGLLSTAPTSQSSAIYPIRGGSFAVSANGNTNGILWAIQSNGASGNDVNAPGVLFAYDATNLADELYDSTESGSRDTMDYAAKFNVPLVANGKVFVASQSQLTAYGLLP